MERLWVGTYSRWDLSFRNLALFLDLLDDSHANGGSHVADGESSKLWNVLEVFKHHRSERSHFDESAVAYFEERGLLLNYLTRSRVQLAYQLLEGHPDGSGMSVQHGSVSGSDSRWMVDDDDLANECLCDRRRVVSVAHNFPSTNLILGNTAYVEPYVVSGFRFGHSNMVSLDRLALADFARWHEDHFVPVLQYARLDPSHWDSADSGYGVDVLDWNSQWFVKGLRGWNNSVQRIKYAGTLVPWRIGTLLGEIISKPTTGGNEINLGNIIADSLQQSLQFLPGFLVTLFSILDSLVVHLIDGYNQLLNAEGPCEVRVFPRLASRSNGYFELSLLCRNYEYSNIRLASPRDHVLDEVAVSRRIDNRVEVMRSLEFLE